MNMQGWKSSPDFSFQIIAHKKTMAYGVGNLGPGLGQTQKCYCSSYKSMHLLHIYFLVMVIREDQLFFLMFNPNQNKFIRNINCDFFLSMELFYQAQETLCEQQLMKTIYRDMQKVFGHYNFLLYISYKTTFLFKTLFQS